MKTQIELTNGFGGDWWRWIETCDRCGKTIQDHSLRTSAKPDTDEADFCVECIRYFLDAGIPYEESRRQYK